MEEEEEEAGGNDEAVKSAAGGEASPPTATSGARARDATRSGATSWLADERGSEEPSVREGPWAGVWIT